jgi:PKD repeat protein
VLGLACLLGGASSSAQEPLFTFAQVSDCQPQTTGEYERFEDVLQALTSAGQPGALLPRPVEFVLFAGDVVWGNTEPEWLEARARLDQYLTASGIPFRCVPGNHDVTNSDTALYEAYIGSADVWEATSAALTGHNGLSFSSDWGGLRFIGFNNSNPGWNTIEPGDLAEIETHVAAACAAGENVFLLCHHPHDERNRVPLAGVLPEPCVVGYMHGHIGTPLIAQGLAGIANSSLWELNTNSIVDDRCLIYFEAFQTELRAHVVVLDDLPTELPAPVVIPLVQPLFPVIEPDLGHEGPPHDTAGPEPSAAAPENRLWLHDGEWWGVLWSENAASYRIFRLDQGSQTWIDTGTVVSSDPERRFDALLSSSTLCLASHRSAVPAEPGAGEPGQLLRFGYDDLSGAWSAVEGFPVAVNDTRSETLSLERDSTGTLWASWTQDGSVYLNHTLGGDDAAWDDPEPLLLPQAGGLAAQDTSALVAFDGKLGLLWSNAPGGELHFAVRADGSAPDAWSLEETGLPGALAGDEFDLATLAGDVFAVVRAPAGELTLLHRPAAPVGLGVWSSKAAAAASDQLGQPILVADQTNLLLHLFATGPTPGGQGHSSAGAIWEKDAPLATLAFPPGRGTSVIQDGQDPGLGRATTTRQVAGSAGGLVVLSSNASTARYWHAFDSLAAPLVAPSADLHALPVTGFAPLAVRFFDLSSGSPSWWSWDFGDGEGSNEQHPVHAYDQPGTYTVSLRVANGGGESVLTLEDLVTVEAAPVVQTFTPIADARVNQANPDANFGSSSTLRVRLHATDSFWSYLRFDLAGLEGQPSSALLRLFCTDGSPAGGTAYLVSNDWTEGGITWNNRPGLPPDPLASFGGVSTGLWAELDASAAVTGPGLVSLALAAGDSNSAIYSSREAAGQEPELVVELEEVCPPPGADFSADPLFGLAPLLVAFTDLSSGAPTSWSWAFGDGQGSSAQHPVHQYTTPGVYTVLLDVTNAGGLDSLTRLDYVKVLAPVAADFTGSPTSGGAALTVAFTDLSSGAPTSWSWDFGDGGGSSAQHPTHRYTVPGTYSVSLTVMNGASSDTLVRADYVVVGEHVPPFQPTTEPAGPRVSIPAARDSGPLVRPLR